MLNKNRLITIKVKDIESLSGGHLPSSEIDFITELEPLLSTPSRVRKVAGSYLAEMDDFIIYQLLFKYSLEAIEGSDCDHSDKAWIMYARKWTAFKTVLDLIYNAPLFLQESNGKVYKKLGDFAISKEAGKSGDSSAAGKMIERVECEIFKLNHAVFNCLQPLLTCENVSLDDIYTPRRSEMVTKGENVWRPLMGRGLSQVRSGNPLLNSFLINQGRLVRTN